MTLDSESERLAALHRYRILDTDPERAFDDLTLLASHICSTPIALISLIDKDRQWFKSRQGLSLSETSRSIAFCAHAIQQRDLLVITDTHESDTFRDNPLVRGEPGIRFYAGAPLTTPGGHALGTLCVMDRKPRTLTAGQLEALEAIRRQAQAQLELRVQLRELEAALAGRDVAEAKQRQLIAELSLAMDDVRKLSALVPLCAACSFNMVIPADPLAIPKVTDGVKHMLQEKQWPEDRILAVELALQEALANAIRHGCRNDSSRHVQCLVTVDEAGEIVMVVRDPGSGFQAAALTDPLQPENILKPNGRGIFLINQLMDAVNFRDGGREVEMRKRKE
jgi:anti-sigma regulatory factor (Ser/Thr protein kinase)